MYCRQTFCCIYYYVQINLKINHGTPTIWCHIKLKKMKIENFIRCLSDGNFHMYVHTIKIQHGTQLFLCFYSLNQTTNQTWDLFLHR